MLDFNFLLADSSGLMTIGLVIGMFVLLYFFMIRPQKKREKEEAAMRDAVQVGDEVTTIGGIIGKVISVKGETFVLESTKDRTRLRFLKGAIRSVDVRAADIAAAILETKEVAPTEAEEEPIEEAVTETDEIATVEQTNLSKRAARKARRAAAAAAAASAMSQKMIEEANAIAEENDRIEAEKAARIAATEENTAEETATEETATEECAVAIESETEKAVAEEVVSEDAAATEENEKAE